MKAIPRKQSVEEVLTPLERDYQLWLDMVETPAQYGDCQEWLDLNDELLATRKAWKIERYWRKEAEKEEKKEAAVQAKWKKIYSAAAAEAATLGMRRWIRRDVQACVRKFRGSAVRIQAAVRGHQVRSHLAIRDCCMCLSHRICPLKTDVGFMCRDCAAQGPYTDETGPISDPWNDFRADYVDCTRLCVKA